MDEQLLKALFELGAIGLAALSIFFVLRSSGATQRATLDVLNKQMANENKRDTREDRQLDETKRHNLQMETFLNTQNDLMKQLAEDNVDIKRKVGSIFRNTEAIVDGVNAMNADALANELKKMNELLQSINDKLDEILAPSPTAQTDPATLGDKPFADRPHDEKTQPLATPGTTVKEEKQTKLAKSEKTEFSATIPPFDKPKNKQ